MTTADRNRPVAAYRAKLDSWREEARLQRLLSDRDAMRAVIGAAAIRRGNTWRVS